MASFLHRGSAPAFAKRQSSPWREFFIGVAELVRTRLHRRQQRQELLDYLALDHRAAADIGITGQEARNWGITGREARNWAERPFCRD